MTTEQGLFRQEALDARRGQWLGSIHLATPLSRWIWVALGSALAAAIVAFLVFGHYTRRERVTGELVPSSGLLGITATGVGTITRVFVGAGDAVRQGDRLVEISGERDSATLGGTHARISEKLREQRRRLKQDLVTQKRQSDARDQALRSKLDLLREQTRQVDGELRLESREVADAVKLLARIQPLRAKGYVSALQVQQRRTAALNARTQMKNLILQRLQIRQQTVSARQQLAQLPLDVAKQHNATAGQIADIDEQLIQNEAERARVLRAPCDGFVSVVLAKRGQHVVAGQSLLSIVPRGAMLQAQLLVPSRAVGFIEPGSRVVLRYQAFPYQKFGQQYGHVASISRSALSPDQVVALIGQRAQQPLYRVKVRLQHQAILTYGKPRALKPGMALSADILMDRRSLLQWVFEPLYGLRQTLSMQKADTDG